MNSNNTTKKLIAISCKLSGKKLSANSYKLKATRGFTLVELMVTLSLFVVLTTIVLFSNSKFNGSILLTNLAYDVAITIRQAQTFGVNVREVTSENDLTKKFQHAYGVHFDIKINSAGGDNKQFILFADKSNSRRYSFNGNEKCNDHVDECVDKYSIKRGNHISALCITPKSSNDSSEDCDIKKLDIAFVRPNPDAIINGDKSIIEAKIVISSADGNSSRNIVVNSTGQISVER